jgi:2-dehydropantoate 2-reductase
MNFAVRGGGGAMGGLFGGGLAAAGHDVSLVDVAPAAIDAINTNGLRIEEKSGEVRTIKVGREVHLSRLAEAHTPGEIALHPI